MIVQSAPKTGELGLCETKVEGETRRFSLYLPPGYDPNRRWPLIVFLHGIGERGDDGAQQTTEGIGPALRRWPERYPCLVVLPQCPERLRWEWDASAVHIEEPLAHVKGRYSVDDDRVYLAGISMGGGGTWRHGGQFRQHFAALLPICGLANPEVVSAIRGIPTWVFHGAQDEVIAVGESRRMVELLGRSGVPPHYTEIAEGGHNVWDQVFADPAVPKWLLAQRRAGRLA